jgi:signal transduction histidine kinase
MTAARDVGFAAPRRSASLEWRLPRQMAGVLALVLVATVGLAYATLARDALATQQDRLDRSASQIAAVAGNSVRAGRARYLDAARDTALRRALREAARAPGSAALDASALAALRRLSTPADSGMPTELWTADGRRLAFLGRDVRTTVAPRAASDASEAPVPVPGRGLRPLAPGDSLGFGWLYAEGERTRFWLVAPVFDDAARPLGYIVQQRRVGGNPQTDRTLRELAGTAVAGYYRNPDGAFWSSLSGRPAEAPARAADGRWSRPDAGPLLHAEAPVAGTPLTLVFEVPRRQVLEPARRAALSLSAIGVALLAVGTALSWGVSRRITAPLRALTRAAESLGRGDLNARAPVVGDDEVARLAAAFNGMAHDVATSRAALEAQSEAADAANRAKSDFLAVMSHELRTPLNAIGGYAELMAMGIRGPLTDAQARDLERIRVSQQHLLGLVSAVLDMNRIERRQLAYDLVPVALGPFLAGLDALVAPQAAAKALHLVCAASPSSVAALADREKLRQIVLNLLSNAIRFTPAGGTITLDAAPGVGDTVEVRVRDTGVGIPEARQAQIFEPFVQLDRSLTQSRDGIGLGLAISRDLARGMGGDLTVCSRPGEGATFTVTLPRAAAPAPNEPYLSGEMAAIPGT